MKPTAATTEKEPTTDGSALSLETRAALNKLKQINEEVGALDPALRERAISLLLEREFQLTTPRVAPIFTGSTTELNLGGTGPQVEFAGLVEKWTPSNGNEWALLAAYQLSKGKTDGIVTGQEINTVLKHHGKGVSNVTKAIARLARADPALMLQVRKDGTSRQARKSYKVTTSGVSFVETHLRGTSGGGS